jgi:peptidoglycan/xylan/chitin deacetylase (PgdA/CDA1 family)
VALRRLMKRTVVSASALMRREKKAAHRSVALCYHSVHRDKPFATVTPEMFERHLAWISEHCDAVLFDGTGVAMAQGPEHRDRPLVMVTFDDGYDDNFDNALPLLQKYGVPATFFLTTGFIERDPATLDRFGSERQSDSAMMGALEWSQIEEMRSAGMVFGAHGHTHRNLATLSGPALADELRISRDILQQRLSQPVLSMAYPYGKPGVHFTDETVRVVADCGYELCASITLRGIRPSDPNLAIPRFFVARDEVATLEEKVLGLWDAIGLWQSHSPMWARRLLSPADFAH